MASKLLAAVDVGTTKTVVFISEVTPNRRLNIIGIGERKTNGMRKGEIIDLAALKETVHRTIHDAEQQAGAQVSAAYLSLTGYHLRGERSIGMATVSGSNRCVSANDMERARQEAKHRQPAEGRICISHIHQPFFLDDEMRENPLGMTGKRLEASTWDIDASEKYVRDLIHITGAYSLYVPDLIVSSLASGRMVTSEAMRRHGVLVADIGGGTTDYVLYRKGYVASTGVLPIGGDHITNDLSLGLRIKHEDAESLKCGSGSAIVLEEEAKSKIWIGGGGKNIGDTFIPAHAMNQIIHARVDELFTILRSKLGPSFSREEVAAGVVLTGGTAQLRNIEQAAAQALGVDARVGELPNWISDKLARPQYGTAHGLLDFALNDDAGKQNASPENLWSKIRSFIPF